MEDKIRRLRRLGFEACVGHAVNETNACVRSTLLRLSKQHGQCSERAKKPSSVFALFLGEGEMSWACIEILSAVNNEIDGKRSLRFRDLHFVLAWLKGFDILSS